jgi:hypothetical protein
LDEWLGILQPEGKRTYVGLNVTVNKSVLVTLFNSQNHLGKRVKDSTVVRLEKRCATHFGDVKSSEVFLKYISFNEKI